MPSHPWAPVERGDLAEIRRRRVLRRVRVEVHGHARGLRELAHTVDRAGAEQALIRDEDDGAQTEGGQVVGQTGDRTGAVVHARRALEEVNAVPGHRRQLPGGGAVEARSISAGGKLSSTSRGGEPAICSSSASTAAVPSSS